MRTKLEVEKNTAENRPAQALVEFALVLPLLLLLMAVMIDLGVLFYTQMVVVNAAWEGARAGATIANPDQGDSEIYGAVKSSLFGLDHNKVQIEIDPEQDQPPRNLPFPAPRGEPITVTVIYPLELTFLDLDVPVTAKAVSRMEYQNP